MSQGQGGNLHPSSVFGRLLPLEIGFLADHGFALEMLHHAAALAEAAGVSADEVLMKTGLVREDEFYRALARELRLPFLTAPILSKQANFPGSILSGFAPLPGGPARFVAAPREQQLSRLLQSRRSFGPRLAITTPTALRQAVFASQAQRIAHHAAHQLPTKAPHLSSRDGGTTGQVLILSGTCASLLWLGVLFPVPAIGIFMGGLTPLFLGMVLLRLAATVVPVTAAPVQDAPRQADATLPIYTVIAPLYHERKVAGRLVRALRSLDYPAVKLDIKLVVEADDPGTLLALSRLQLPAFFEIVIAPPGQPRTKPRALNVALPLARGEFTVIYDAEDIPDRDQLRLAVTSFAEQPDDVACLQARLTIDNSADTWLTRLFAIEYASLFDVLNPGLVALGCPIPLGGTSNHFRTSVLRRVCGWDAWNVTEDADLGIRLARFGYRTADLLSSTLEEAPRTLGAWLKQRTRWMKGYVQTCLTHSRQPLVALEQLGPSRFGAAVALTFGTVLSALVYPFFTVLSLLALSEGLPLTGDHIFAAIWSLSSLLLFALGFLAIVVPALMAVHRRRLWSLLLWVVALPFYYLLVSLAAWLSLLELARHPFRWNKTEHGLARTSRSRRAIRSFSEDPARLPRAGG